jgi:hypothetical protein
MKGSAAKTKGLRSCNSFNNSEFNYNIRNNLQNNKYKNENQKNFKKNENNKSESEEELKENFQINKKILIEDKNEKFIEESHKESEMENDYLEEEEENEQDEDDILSQNLESKNFKKIINNKINKNCNISELNNIKIKSRIKENDGNKKPILAKKCKSNKHEQLLINKKKEGSPFCLETYNFNHIKEKICLAFTNLRNCLRFFKKRKYNRKKINFPLLFISFIIFIAAVVFTYFCFIRKKKESLLERMFSSVNNFFNLKYDFKIIESISFFNLKKIASYLQFSVSLT